METLQHWDEQIVLAVNGWHSHWLDSAMILMTQTAFWTPLYMLIIFFLFKRMATPEAWLVLAAVAVTILISDQTTSGFMKPFFERLRPSHHPELSRQLHLVNGYTGGRYGFASSHAANAFALATVLFLTVRQKLRGMQWLFAWAAFMSFTRLYLGVHYLTDLLAGTAVGIAAGLIGYRTATFLRSRLQSSQAATTNNNP